VHRRRAILNKTLRWRCLGALLLGAAGVAGFAPLGWFPLNWLSLGGLFALLVAEADGDRRPWHGALIGASHALRPVPHRRFLDLCQPERLWRHAGSGRGPGDTALLRLFSHSSRRSPGRCSFASPLPTGCVARCSSPALWVLAECLRAWAFTGFPWLSAGYSQTPPSPLAGYAPLLGVHGVSLFSALLGGTDFRGQQALACPPKPAARRLAALVSGPAAARHRRDPGRRRPPARPPLDGGARRTAVGRPAAG
jgi:apolipoprotein N-acyltransferase